MQPTIDLSDEDLVEMDDPIATHMMSVRAARELKRHRATTKRLEAWADEMSRIGEAGFARELRGKLREP